MLEDASRRLRRHGSLITADRIVSKSTHDLIAEFLTEVGLDA
jgi:hypothetical protein